jgi:tetratricopeptide (TPR) repeat protein
VLATALVSQAREQGEVLLVLGWQEGEDAGYLRGYSFLLDFWEGGVKGFTLMDSMSRPRFEREVRNLVRGERESETVPLVPVNWAEARRLVLEALAVNTWRNTQADADFSRYRSQIEKRLLDEPTTEELRQEAQAEVERAEREGDRPYISLQMEAEEVAVNWLGAWTFGDFGLAYDLLTDDHPEHRRQSRSEYVALRRTWWNEAQPAGLRVTLVREQEKRASALWVPESSGRLGLTQQKELEAYWSVVLREVELGGELPELPLATLASKSTGRHWYWTGYTMSRDAGSGRWGISRSRDEGANSQALTLEELQQRLQDAHQRVEKITAEAAPEPGTEAAAEALQAITGALTSSLHYSDALVLRLPLDETVYRAAITDARTLGNHERAAALIERMRGRFADETRLHFEQGIEEYLVAEQYSRQGMAPAHATWLERAIATLREVVAAEPTAEHLQGLAELLSRQGHFNQAETYLREAALKDPTRALIFSDLADTLMGRITGENLDDPVTLSPEEQKRIAGEALAALGQAGKLDRRTAGLYTRMGAIYDLLQQPDDALISLEEAVRQDPADADAHYTLGAMLMDRKRYEDALSHFITAVQLAPLALQARLSLAACYGILGQRAEANRELDAIDRLQPGLPQVAELRSQLVEQTKRR